MITKSAWTVVGLAAMLATAGMAAGQVKISQVYPPGGTETGPKQDVVELYNPTGAPVSLSGWSLQYATATGATWTVLPLSGTVPAYGYFLVQIEPNSMFNLGQPLDGVSQPVADLIVGSSSNPIGGQGKMALRTSTAVLSGTCPVSGGAAGLSDFVGWSNNVFNPPLPPGNQSGAPNTTSVFVGAATTNCSEGAVGPGAIVALSVSASSDAAFRDLWQVDASGTYPVKGFRRRCGGLTDSENNFNDFEQYRPVKLRSSLSLLSNGVSVAVAGPAGAAAQQGQTVEFTVSGTDCAGGAYSGTDATADLTAIGGGASVPLVSIGGGQFTLSTTVGAVSSGVKGIVFRVGPYGTGAAFGATRYELSVVVPNDECAAATVLTGTGPWTWNNNGATTNNGGVNYQACDTGMASGIDRDVWVRWVAPSSGVYTVSTRNTLPSTLDTRLAVFDACGAGAALVCNDNANGLQAVASLSATGGQTYWIQLGVNGTDVTSQGSLSITAGDLGGCCPANFGACVELSSTDCAAQGGVFRGAGTACATLTPCATGPVGACCNASSGCSAASESDCLNVILTPQPATWQGPGTVCGVTPCPPGGSCCVGTACAYLTAAACAGQGGVWTENADATVCSSVLIQPCQPRGVCCFPNQSCLFGSLQSNCENAGGTWTAGTQTGACDFASACGGATSVVCCRGSTCAVVAAADCTVPAGPVVGVALPDASGCGVSNSATAGCCFADFNKLGGVTIDDIFIYLNAWFAPSEFANVGEPGTPNIDDIFIFLNAWFVGCV
jgi:hypothetical protein